MTPNHIYFLGAISNFQLDLLTELTPQLTNNPCESLNAILQNKYNLGHINLSSMVSGIYNFFSERRDKFRIFNAGLKVAKRKRSDLNHFIKLQFIARNLKSAIRESTFNYIFIQDIFMKRFSNLIVEKNSNALYRAECPHCIPQIVVPDYD